MPYREIETASGTFYIEERTLCWGCGIQVRDELIASQGFGGNHPVCRNCRNAGAGQWMTCTSCERVQRPNNPGQKEFTCARCRREKQENQ